jgi:putative phosphoribosyl transferase
MFRDRKDAGRRLAEKLGAYRGREDVLVLALPRGGAVTGYEIARALLAPLDVIIVRKLGFPGESELAVGAICETGALVLNDSIISSFGVPDDYVQSEIARQKQEIARRVDLYRNGKGISGLEGKTVVLVDDGVATGATMKAAISALKQENIAKLIVALPVSPPSTASELSAMVDEFICIETPPDFMAVGSHYQNFIQVSDQEVVDLLQRSAAEAA